MTLCIFILMVIGLIYIVTQSALLSPLRQWLSERHLLLEVLIYCPACTGFWVGLGLSMLGYWAVPLEAAIIACGVGALWGVYGPETVWARERGYDNTQEEEDE